MTNKITQFFKVMVSLPSLLMWTILHNLGYYPTGFAEEKKDELK